MEFSHKTAATSILSRRFTLIEEQRKVSLWRQTTLLFKRNMTNALRNPLQLLAVVILGVVQSFLLVMLFGGVGDVTIGLENLNNSQQIIFSNFLIH